MRIALGLLLLLIATGVPSAKADPSRVTFRFVQPSEQTTIADLCCDPGAVFDGAEAQSVSSGVGGDPIWIGLPSMPPGSVIAFTRIVDRAVLYERLPARAEWRVSVAGDSVVRAGSALAVPRVAFELSSDLGPEAVRYLQVTQPNTVEYGLTLWDRDSFERTNERERTLFLLLLGFIAAIALYNLAVSFVAREPVFALNAMTIVSLIFVDLYLSGMGRLHLWPPHLSNLALNVALASTILFGATFMATFLSFDDRRPRAANLLYVVSVPGLPVLLSGAVLPYYLPLTALLVLVVLMMLLAVSITVLEALKGNKNARLLVIPLAAVMLPGGALLLLRAMTDLDLGYGDTHILEIMLALEALAFSLALAARIRHHRSAAEQARTRLAEAELEIARRFVALQEQERARIASELHDSVGHNVVVMKALMDAAEVGRASGDDIRAASSLAKRTLGRIRELSHDLHPDTVARLGWTKSVDALFAGLERAWGIAVDVRQEGGEPRLDDDARLHLYRVFQEAVSNIGKHSGASAVTVRIVSSADGLSATVRDDGRGLPDGLSMQEGLGLRSIAQRIKTLGGSWSIASNGEAGTTLTIAVPASAGHGRGGS